MEDKELLKQYMLFAGVNASQLAEEIEVSKQYILNLRNGQFKVSAIFAKKLEKPKIRKQSQWQSQLQ